MAMQSITDVIEQARLNEAREQGIPWKKWGPYLSERQWGTVREDYSDNGDAWAYFSHDQARSRAYRWGEDGLAGISDDKQLLCFALALWNERDPILKERLFGLTNSEGNHGEDVKEYYFYLDSTPTHSYMKYLYKYPQREFPYRDLVETNRARSREDFEYELLDTGAFDEDRYFDVFVEYAKGGPEDVLVRITVHNRGPEAARLRVLPTLWFRNTWSWGGDDGDRRCVRRAPRRSWRRTTHWARTGLHCDGAPELLFTENESNAARLWHQPNAVPFVKDAFHACVVVGPGRRGEPRPDGHEGRGALRAGRAGRRKPDDSPAADTRRAGHLRRVRGLRRGVRDPPRGGRRVLRADHAAHVERRPAPCAPPGARRHAVEQAVLLLRSRTVAQRAQEPSAARVGARRACGTPSGSTCSTPTSSRCRTSGSTPGTRRGTSRSTPRRSPWWTSTSRRSSCS